MTPGKGATQLVGLSGPETCYVYGQLVHLVLEEDDAVGALQGALLQRVVEADLLPPGATADVLRDAVVDPHTRTHRAYFVGHVGQVSRSYAGDGLHLGRRLHLEDAHCIGAVQHVVHRLIIEVDAGKVRGIAGTLVDEQEGVLHLGKSA